MLDNLYITKSKIRRDLLALFFTNKYQKYYLRELERTLQYSAGSIRRELLKFQKDDLFITEKQGNLLYYRLNTNHPLFKELESIISKTIGLEARLKLVLSSIIKIEAAFIYGSYAKNTDSAKSDIDLFIIGDPDENKLIEKINKLEKELKREINYNIYSKSDFEKKKKQKDAFIKDVLESKKILLVGGNNDL
ncbi:MAG: nucleotidyltransferase domain-containing protein [Candidatus Omnitrophica bacterium]|nr:nucleotidyltransferase domain-containing protein [Candidatus Omnitrophota bacterium]